MARAQTPYRTGSKGLSGVQGAVKTRKKRFKAPGTPSSKKAEARVSFAFKLTRKDGFVALYKAPALTQVGWIKRGVSARDAKAIVGELHVPQADALTALQIPTATVNRKARTNAPLSPSESERVLGVGRLLGQLQTMVQESGNPDGFDAAAWLSAWMSAPVPALGGARPLDLMGTMTGQALVSQLLAQMQSGAYA